MFEPSTSGAGLRKERPCASGLKFNESHDKGSSPLTSGIIKVSGMDRNINDPNEWDRDDCERSVRTGELWMT
jgi:hypothetical protein